MKVYLAGPMTGCTRDAMEGWRTAATAALLAGTHITTLSPLRGAMVEGERAEFYRDWWDIQHADIVLVNLSNTTHVSIGTVCEMMLAKALHKYIVAVLDERHDHLFTRECTAYRAKDLDDAIKHIRSSFGRK